MRGAAQVAERERENLMVQVHPWVGERMARECLRPPAAPQDTVAYGYLGDMQLRLVFERPGETQTSAVRPEDLARLELTPQKAIAHAVANAKRAGGTPQVAPLAGGVYALRGRHADYNATYLLDRAFWRQQLEKFPRGLLAALPRKGVLLFAPAGDAAVEEELARQAGRIRAAAGDARTSDCLYRFDAAGWQPVADLPRPAAAPAPAAAVASRPQHAQDDGDSPAEDDDGLDLDKAAQGQRMLVFSILLTFGLNGAARAGALSPLLLFALYGAVAIFSLVGVVRLCSGLGKSTGQKIVYMVLSCVPLVSLAAWIVLSVQATRVLRAAGWRVGLLGARA